MRSNRVPDYFSGYSFVPYVSFVIKRTNFIGWKVNERTVEDHELVLIGEGRGSLKAGSTRYPCERGTMLYLHENLWHSIEADPETPITFYSVHFSFARARHAPENWSYHEDINYYLKDRKSTGKVWSFRTRYELLPFDHAFKVSNLDKVLDCFIDLNRTYYEKKTGYELRLNASLLELLDILFNETHFHPDNASNIDKLKAAVDYIQEHYRETIRLEQLVNHLGISQSRLIQLFKKNTGKTPIHYINQVKVNHAKDLLLSSGKTIKETAFALGFQDEFYFSRVFKKLEGISPRDFKSRV
ncbi:MAG: helix-turn-helix transcriptional regulator [Spirochaetales bacterium]|nr:helix-turn-helix transcriptional regulator [Spirochaetales bacterium]